MIFIRTSNVIPMAPSHDPLRSIVRSIIQEQAAMAPAIAAGRTLDTNGLNAFLQQAGVFGHEENIMSIVEGDPTPKVMDDMTEYVAFHALGTDPAQLQADEVLQYYLEWNGLNIDKNQVLAFSISEKGQ